MERHRPHSKIPTRSEMSFTYGHFLYDTACKNSYSPDCPHAHTFPLREPPERPRNLFRHFPLLNRPQYHFTASPWVLGYLVATASLHDVNALMWLSVWPPSFRMCHAMGGQSLPGGGTNTTSGYFLRDRVGFRSCPERVASHRVV